MPAGEFLDDRAGVHPCTAHRRLPADQLVLTAAACASSELRCAALRVTRGKGLWLLRAA